MVVVVESKTTYRGTVTLSVGTEVTIVEVGTQANEYIVEGWIDLGNLQSGDDVTVKEYVKVDGVNYRLFVATGYSGPVSEPIIRFHSKTLCKDFSYKVTITQTSGTARDVPYCFIVMVLGER